MNVDDYDSTPSPEESRSRRNADSRQLSALRIVLSAPNLVECGDLATAEFVLDHAAKYAVLLRLEDDGRIAAAWGQAHIVSLAAGSPRVAPLSEGQRRSIERMIRSKYLEALAAHEFLLLHYALKFAKRKAEGEA